MQADAVEQEDELLALRSIFGSEFSRDESKAAGEIRVAAELPAGFTLTQGEGATLRQCEISFLPPVHLTFELPEDYPSSSPPSFTLTCSWLTRTQLSALAAHLADIYQASRGAVVLFTWVGFLREEALRFLDIHSLLELPSDEHSTQDSVRASLSEPNKDQRPPESRPKDNLSCDVTVPHQQDLSAPSLNPAANSGPDTDDRTAQTSDVRTSDASQEGGAASLPIDPGEPPLNETRPLSLLSRLVTYEAAQRQKRFAAAVFDCSVCCVGRLGSDCARLPDCGHVFCRVCLAQFYKAQITEGNVRGVACPQADCSAGPTPAQVRSLVGEEPFSRYDRLLLLNALDCMPDVVYCPRRPCSSAVIREESSTAAVCSVCSFAFCVTCRKTYHGIDDCQGKKKTEPRENPNQQGSVEPPQSEDGIKALWDDYASSSEQRQHLLESRYGRNVLQVNVAGHLSESWIELNSKSCPYCSCRIQKNSGCNMMTCSRCRQVFCWACLAPLRSPDLGKHFQEGPCVQY